MNPLTDVSNEDLLARLRMHVRKGHAWQAQLIAYLVEVEDRRLHLTNAYTSMWDFCLRGYGMSENEAQLRLAAARVVRGFPVALTYLERGDIHLSGLAAIANYLTAENHEDLLRDATSKSVRAIEAMLATRFPKPDVPSTISPVTKQPEIPVTPNGAESKAPLPEVPPPPERRPRVEPLSAARYRVELTISAEMKARLDHVQDLMRHANPSGDLETIFGRALLLLEKELEKWRLGKTARPGKEKEANESSSKPQAEPDFEPCAADPTPVVPSRTAAPATLAKTRTKTKRKKVRRTVRRSVRRAVFARDGEQCTYVDENGNRCPACTPPELDHIVPKARGGADTIENLRVRCRAHNKLHAEESFGRAHVAEKIHYGRAKYAAAPVRAVEVAASGLHNLGFRDADVRRVLARLETTIDAGASCETLVREALRLLT